MINIKPVQKIAKYGMRITLTRELKEIGVCDSDKVKVEVSKGNIIISKIK
jgi:antitoxin component of MazEF toxin-antitoxin module